MKNIQELNAGTPLHCIAYMSTATKPMNSDELLFLLEQSREKNKRLEITGMLVYSLGNFVQILEGSAENVKGVYHSITQDSRHFGILKLIDKTIKCRSFSEWSMGFRTMNENCVLDLKAICQSSLSNDEAQKDPTLMAIRNFVVNNS